jgi:hypothetical protein
VAVERPELRAHHLHPGAGRDRAGFWHLDGAVEIVHDIEQVRKHRAALDFLATSRRIRARACSNSAFASR